MNHHTLSDFRVGHGPALDGLLTQSVGALMAEDLVDLEQVAQDGVRVRASAGSGSFRSAKGLAQCLEEAEAQVAALKAEIDADPAAASQRQKAAQERGARERLERVKKALAQREEAAAKKKTSQEQEDTRASTTDPEARVMKMADGGFRPAYNVQLSTDVTSQVIVGVEVTNRGNDFGEMGPMVGQIEERFGKTPDIVLVDGGFASHDEIERVTERGITVYAPVMVGKKAQRDPHTPRSTDGRGVAAWRVRMGTEEAKVIYKARAATAECVNAIARNRGLRQFLVRGLAKVRVIAILFALAHNCMRAVALRSLARATG